MSPDNHQILLDHIDAINDMAADYLAENLDVRDSELYSEIMLTMATPEFINAWQLPASPKDNAYVRSLADKLHILMAAFNADFKIPVLEFLIAIPKNKDSDSARAISLFMTENISKLHYHCYRNGYATMTKPSFELHHRKLAKAGLEGLEIAQDGSKSLNITSPENDKLFKAFMHCLDLGGDVLPDHNQQVEDRNNAYSKIGNYLNDTMFPKTKAESLKRLFNALTGDDPYKARQLLNSYLYEMHEKAGKADSSFSNGIRIHRKMDKSRSNMLSIIEALLSIESKSENFSPSKPLTLSPATIGYDKSGNPVKLTGRNILDPYLAGTIAILRLAMKSKRIDKFDVLDQITATIEDLAKHNVNLINPNEEKTILDVVVFATDYDPELQQKCRSLIEHHHFIQSNSDLIDNAGCEDETPVVSQFSI